MDVKAWSLLLVFLLPVVMGKGSYEERRAGYRRGLHYHTKRHMLPSSGEVKKRVTTVKPREIRKKPSGHLKPLDEDDMENDEVVSVAVGPPPIRPKYEKTQWKQNPKQPSNHNNMNSNYNNNNDGNYTVNYSATNLVKDVLSQVAHDFLTHQISEDFVFGQYVGNAMKNLTSDLRLRMQHEVLEIVVNYQKLNRGDFKTEEIKMDRQVVMPVIKEVKPENKKLMPNDTEENWPDFSNLAKIVGRR